MNNAAETIAVARPQRRIFNRSDRWESDFVPERRALLDEPPPQSRRLVRWLIAATVALVAMAGLGLYLQYRPLPFSPDRWKSAGAAERGRMLSSLRKQTDFVGFTRPEVEYYLGAPDFDERQFWYDLGRDTSGAARDARARIGDPQKLYGVFNFSETGAITEVLYSRRRPVLGSAPFDSAGWSDGSPTERRLMFTNSLSRLRSIGLSYANAHRLLGPHDGIRVRGQYAAGSGGGMLGTAKALIVEYDDLDVVVSSHVTE